MATWALRYRWDLLDFNISSDLLLNQLLSGSYGESGRTLNSLLVRILFFFMRLRCRNMRTWNHSTDSSSPIVLFNLQINDMNLFSPYCRGRNFPIFKQKELLGLLVQKSYEWTSMTETRSNLELDILDIFVAFWSCGNPRKSWCLLESPGFKAARLPSRGK